MNRLRKTYLPFILFVLAITLVSCDEMEDNYAPFIESGEILYTPKAQELIALSGYEKIQFKWDVTSNKSITDWIISYGENKIPVSNDELADKEKEYLLTGVEEGSHEFSIYSISDTGNESIYTKLTAEVYGAEYKAKLDPRAIKTVSYDGVDIVIVFQSSVPSGGLTEVKYMNTSNVEITKTIEKDELILDLENVSIESPVLIRTYYLPTPPIDGEDTSFEEIASDWSEITLPDFSELLESVIVEPGLEEAKITWVNTDMKDIRVNVVYTLNGNVETETVVTDVVDGEMFVPLNVGESTIVVSIADPFGNQLSKRFTVTPIPSVYLNKSAWTVIDFSSQAAGNEASFLIDGDYDTMWGSDDILDPPHHVSFDMGEEKDIHHFELHRYDWWTSYAYEIYVSSDSTTWTKVAEASDNVDNPYAIASRATKARYVKFVITDAYYPKYVFFKEVDIWGL